MIFLDLFFGLRAAGLKIGLGDWMGLMRALEEGLIAPDLSDFYVVARALLIKNEAHFDVWDQVFAGVFGGGTVPKERITELLDWLSRAKPPRGLTPEQLALLERLPLSELQKRFEELLRTQKERHDGGSRFIGTGGTSPFGHGGSNPAGVRMGGGGGGRSAVQVAVERRFADYRQDRVLDDRAMSVALKRLRRLSRHDQPPELDVEESIDKTCRNAGELTLEFRPPRKNQARVLLLLDSGGSMDPYSDMVEQLFSAASQLHHWKKLEAFHFHNCVYEKVYKSISMDEGILTSELLADRPADTFLILVGDALMAASELTDKYGAIQWSHQNTTPGLLWLHRLRTRFPRAVWLNPISERHWYGWTIRIIGQLFPMFPLSVRGIDDAISRLLKTTPDPVPELDPRLARY